MANNEVFQNIDEIDNEFINLEEDEKNDDSFINTFVMGLPDWDLEPLYETVKRRGNE